jgi:hypothetical protein
MTTPYEKKKLYDRCKDLWNDLKTIREPFEDPCDEIIDYFRPDMTKMADDFSNMTFPSQQMYDSFPSWALNTMDKGYRGYTISRSIEWFRHQVSDRRLKGNNDVNDWLQDETEYIYEVYQRSNLYSVLGTFSRQALSTGSPVMIAEEHEGRIVYIVPHPRARYISHNIFGEPDQLVLEWEYRVSEAVDRFGYDNLSTKTQNHYKQGRHNQRVVFLQFCVHRTHPMFKDLPEGEKEDKRPNFNWPNMYIEKETDPQKKKVLYPTKTSTWNKNLTYQTKGYNDRPFFEWPYRREYQLDYAFTPAWFARFDAKSLMQIRKTLLIAAQKSVAPPMYAPQWLESVLKLYPNYINFYDSPERRDDIPKAIQEKINYPFGIEVEDRVVQTLERWFHISFFLLLTRLQAQGGSPPTATQVLGMMGEKAVLLGPTIETQEDQFLRPLDRLTVGIEYKAGRLPEPPPIIFEMGGTEIVPEFVGPLHQAQQEFHNQRRHENILAAAAPYFEIWPMSKYKIKPEVALEELLEKRGYLQDAIASDEEYQQIVSAMAQKQEMQEGLQIAGEMAKALPALNEAPKEGSPAAQLLEAAA